MIFSLNFYLGISFLPGMKSAKSAAPPEKSSYVKGLNDRVKMASFWVNFKTGYIFFSESGLYFQSMHVRSFLI